MSSQIKICSEVLIPYAMSFGPYSPERADRPFAQLIELDFSIGNFVKMVIEQIPIEKLELDIKTLMLNFLILSIEQDILGLIDTIYLNYEFILEKTDRLFGIIMDFYIETLSDEEIENINKLFKNKSFTMFEMLNLIRTKKTSLDEFIDKVGNNKRCVDTMAANGVDFQKIKNQYGICNFCKCDAKFQCGKCNTSRYCSKECQVSDWKRHKKICKSLSH